MVAAWSFESCFGLVRVSVGNGASAGGGLGF
jgi:hypothetical protein